MIYDWPKFAELSAQDAPGPVEEEGSLAAWVAERAFVGQFTHAIGLGWLRWTGKHWTTLTIPSPLEHARQFAEECRNVAGQRVAELLEDTEYQRLDQAWQDYLEEQSGGRVLPAEETEMFKTLFYETADEGPALRVLDTARDGWVAIELVGRKLLKFGRLSAILRFIADIRGVQSDGALYDQNPDLLCCQNGVVHLPTGDLLPHDPEQLITKITAADYRPGFTNQWWTMALDAVTPDGLEWLQMVVGQAITGHPHNQLVLHSGGGENGKSAFMDGLKFALGDHYTELHPKALLANPGDHDAEQLVWRGARLAVLEELPQQGRLSPAVYKRLTDSTRLRARAMRENLIQFQLTHTAMINTNHLPQVSEADHGTWRRLVAVPWPYKFLKKGTKKQNDFERYGDSMLKPSLRTEPGAHEAALAWAVAGAVKWYAAGREMPTLPQSVADLTASWRVNDDHVGRFISENLVAEQGYAVGASELFAAFKRYLGEEGKAAWAQHTFAERLQDNEALREAGVKRDKIRPGAGWTVTIEGGVSIPATGKTLNAWKSLRWRRDSETHLSLVHRPGEQQSS